jgi:hypothetical protein
MFEFTPLEQYSVLEELSPMTPVWRPFEHHADQAHAPVRDAETAGEQ